MMYYQIYIGNKKFVTNLHKMLRTSNILVFPLYQNNLYMDNNNDQIS